MDYLITEMVQHYHEERPHQSLENVARIYRKSTDSEDNRADDAKLRIVCRERLGGRLKHYSLRAA